MPAQGDDAQHFTVTLEAPHDDGTHLRRQSETSGGPELASRVGRAVPFRHRTLDPDDVTDVHIGRKFWSDS
ncbi:hypothetical protein CZ771_14215 [Actinomycetales bacterium JB111]|nr:hypothetical protein CZ771_14215 [Actinomycetales bacterium JB111]